MANHPSALKRHRQALKRTERNKALRTRVRHIVRTLRRAVEQQDTSTATETLGHARRELDMAVTKGLLHRNNAAPKISRLTRAVHKLTTAASS